MFLGKFGDVWLYDLIILKFIFNEEEIIWVLIILKRIWNLCSY